MGFASYYDRFVEGFAKLAAPLHRLVAELRLRSKHSGRQVSQSWTAEHQQSFEHLKVSLINAPLLAYASLNLPSLLF